jgi:hypothetical protein
LQIAYERHQRGHAAFSRHPLNRLGTGSAGGARQLLEPAWGQPRQVEVADIQFAGGSQTLERVEQSRRGGL